MSKYLEYFDGAFDSTVADKLKLENKPYVAYSKTEGVVYTIIPKEDGVYYDITELVKKSIPVPSEGYREVDLGLPSGIKWADRNVGAETPQDNGAYFSWGNVEGVVSNGTTKISEDDLIEQMIITVLIESGIETTPEKIEEVKNDPEMMNEINQMIPLVTGLISEYSFDLDTYSTTLGGQYTGSELDAEHDAATVNMGEEWRMPTNTEIIELVRNTDHYYIDESGNIVAGPFNYDTNPSVKGLDGSKLRSICFAKQGEDFNYNERSNFIEFPFASICVRSLLNSEFLVGCIWSSSAYDIINIAGTARPLYFDSAGYIYYEGSHLLSRYWGQSVRGVRA